MRRSLERWLLARWYGTPGLLWLLFPLEILFRVRVALRRVGRRPIKPAVPVIVIGNIVVGGSGKTPLVLWLAAELRARGFRPGIVSRGHGGRGPFPLHVHPATSADMCGDEPLLLARRLDVPVVVDPNRRAALALLLTQHVDVVISDDGLQHYALARTVEIAVLDGARMFGNGHCLPVGPLREPPARLNEMDFVVGNGALRGLHGGPGVITMQLRPMLLRQVINPAVTISVQDFLSRYGSAVNGKPVVAVAGIGNPQRFFTTLRNLGCTIDEFPFPDHHMFTTADFAPLAGRVLLMTEKDAVKCVGLVGVDAWYLEVEACLPDTFLPALLARAGLPERAVFQEHTNSSERMNLQEKM